MVVIGVQHRVCAVAPKCGKDAAHQRVTCDTVSHLFIASYTITPRYFSNILRITSSICIDERLSLLGCNCGLSNLLFI